MISRPQCVRREREAETMPIIPLVTLDHHQGHEEATWIVLQVWAQLSFEEWMGERRAVRREGASRLRGLKGWRLRAVS